MFDVSAWEIGLVAVVMLVVLGPNKFVELAKTAGCIYKKMRTSWQQTVAEAKQTVDDVSSDQITHNTKTSNDQDAHEP